MYLGTSNLIRFNSSLYDRIQYIIKNIKSNLNVDGHSQLRAFNPERSYKANLVSGNFIENLLKEWWIRLENSLNHSFSLVNIPHEIYLNQAKFRILWGLNKTNVWSLKKNSENNLTWNRSKTRDQNKSNKTNKSIQTFVNRIKYITKNKLTRRQKLIHKIFLDKFQHTNEKIKQLGLLITDKDSLKSVHISEFGSYFPTREVKKFKTHNKKNDPLRSPKILLNLSMNYKIQINNQISNLILKESLNHYFKTHPKHYLKFWWSENKLTNYCVVQTDFSFKNDLFLSILNQSNEINTLNKNNNLFLIGNLKYDFLIISSCLILLHVCLLFTLLNIGQIRTFLKFQLLCIYKVTNIYLTSIYWSFKNLKQLKTTFYLYSNISADLVKNLMLTKKSFFLLTEKNSYKNTYLNFPTSNSKVSKFNQTNLYSYRLGSYFSTREGNVELSKNRNLITYIKSNSKKTPNIVFYSHGQYSVFQDFENSILKSLSFNNRLFHEHNLNFDLKNYTFNHRDYFNIFTLLQQKNSSRLVDRKNEVKSIEQSNIYEQVLDRIINKQNKFEFLNMFILTNKKNKVNNRLIVKQIKPLTNNTLLKNNNFSNFIFQNILYSTNLLCYNILKYTLGFRQTLSLIPSRSVENFSSSSLNKIQIFESGLKNLKVLPNQYESLASLLVNKYIISSFYLSILFFVSILIKISNKSLIGLYIILFKLINLIEGMMLIIYKSLEKPAELMIDFISEFFLIEWSSDIVSFIPETFDIYTSTFSQKLSRNFRIFGFTSFFSQRRFLCFMDSFLEGITKPDIDLIIRQKKGIIFWDIWAEILVQAAEIYNINLSSLFNIKEEQDLFLERLINEKKWNWSTDVLDKMSPLMQSLQNSKPSGFAHNSNLICLSEQIWRRWSVNPYYTYQAKDTDLFVENHPPKSFSHFKLMKYYPPVFEPVGNLVCQIYAGQFVKSISKNLLLIGSRGTNKTLLIQALAGETELKIMIDNAKRYALTSKGIAIGMKLLKDVFDALALQAPCLFIIEDIHIIGERRPMLISDDENIKAMENSFGVDQEEIHEKNQVIYQLSRHSIVHYKKPYKGDFSLLIPTNHFALDLFLSSSFPKTRVIAQVPENPLPIRSIEQEITVQTESENSQNKSSSKYLKFLTQLQLPKKEIFSPPSTSPFTILLLKEQKKIKPKKIVSEMPWGGLSADQLIQLPKASYSVRVKVALLADIAIRNLSVKLDRITDLLIIIDSVRSHRGFVVIGTTHIPSILDPALRRPGRFDETLTIPALPNLWSRWEILKGSISDFSSTLDLMDLAELFNTLNDTELSTIIAKTKLFLLTKQSFLNKNINTQLPNQLLQSNKIKNELSNNKKLELNLLNSFGNVLKFASYPTIIDPFQIKQPKKMATLRNFQTNKNLNYLIAETNFINSNFSKNINPKLMSVVSDLKSFNPALSIFKTSTNCLAISYFQISKWFISSQLIKDRGSYTSLLWSTISKNSMNSSDSLFSSDIVNSIGSYTEKNSPFAIYSSTVELKNQLVQLFAGKIGEFFAFYDIKSMSQLLQENSNEFNENLNYTLFEDRVLYDTKNYQRFWNDFQSINTWKYSSVINLYGINETWGRISDLIFSIIYKRCLYNKTILINRLFNFHNIKSLRQPPSPPVSTSFVASKRYENYKRVEFDLQNRLTFSVHEKIQKHQQQRYIKTLYNKPFQKYFCSELENYTKNSKSSNSIMTTFESSFREMSLIDINQKLQSQNKSSRLTSSNFFFNNRINIRHRFYLINQWWNTQLAEHNAETTFLSEIDWRYMFMDGIGDSWMDFPDTDQHYNPRTRQWMLSCGYWSYWYNFEKLITQEIYYQFLMESFYKAYNVLETSRELLDLTCYEFLTSATLKEIDFINYLKRFYK
jgi:SpoVK/Ycf46/Vps4 family AAA+-type ATPase